MASFGIQIMGLVCVLIALLLSITNYGQEVIDTHAECDTCIKGNVEYTCNCEDVIEYSKEWSVEFMAFLFTGLGLAVIGFFVKDDVK